MKHKQGQIFYTVHPSSSDLHVGRESAAFPLRWLLAAGLLIILAFVIH